MDLKYGDGIDFESSDDSPQKGKKTDPPRKKTNNADQIVRHAYRIPSHELGSLTVNLQGREFDVVNIGNNGIGIKYREEDSLTVSNDPLTITLNFNGNFFTLQAVIVHISPDVTGKYICGIDFLDVDVAARKKIQDLISENRDKLFSPE